MKNKLAGLVIVWASHLLVDVMIGFWAVYKTLMHLDLAVAGLIAALCPFFGESMQVVFGNLGDQGYRKQLFIFGLSATTAATLLPFTENYFLLFLLYLMTCIGSGAFHPSAVAISSNMTQNRKGLFVTIFASGGAFGLATSHLIFTSWFFHFNGNTTALALPTLILIGIIIFIQMPGAPTHVAPKGKRFGFSAMKKLFRSRDLVVLYLSQVFNQAVFWGTIFLLPDVLVSKGYDLWLSFGGGHFFFVMGGALMMVPGGLLSDKYAPKAILLVSSGLGFVLFYTFLITSALSSFLVIANLFCLGACMGISSPVAVSFGNKMMPSRPGLVSAFLMGLVWCISESLGPGGGGFLTKCFVKDAPTKALLCFGVFFIGGMIMTLMLPEKVEKEIHLDFV